MLPQLKKDLGDLPALSSPGEVNMADLLEFPESVRTLLNWIVRQKTAQVAAIAKFLGEEPPAVQELMDLMVKKGLIEEVRTDQGSQYLVNIRAGKKYRVPDKIWKAIE